MRDNDSILLESIYLSICENFDWDTLKFKYSEDDSDRRLDFFNKQGAVGYIVWEKDGGEVSSLFVGEKMRRLGVATFMWETATELSEKNSYDQPEHSSRRSEAGDGFAQSVGGYIPRLTDDVDGWTSRS
jgi:hypothetical protein